MMIHPTGNQAAEPSLLPFAYDRSGETVRTIFRSQQEAYDDLALRAARQRESAVFS